MRQGIVKDCKNNQVQSHGKPTTPTLYAILSFSNPQPHGITPNPQQKAQTQTYTRLLCMRTVDEAAERRQSTRRTPPTKTQDRPIGKHVRNLTKSAKTSTSKARTYVERLSKLVPTNLAVFAKPAYVRPPDVTPKTAETRMNSQSRGLDVMDVDPIHINTEKTVGVRVIHRKKRYFEKSTSMTSTTSTYNLRTYYLLLLIYLFFSIYSYLFFYYCFLIGIPIRILILI